MWGTSPWIPSYGGARGSELSNIYQVVGIAGWWPTPHRDVDEAQCFQILPALSHITYITFVAL